MKVIQLALISFLSISITHAQVIGSYQQGMPTREEVKPTDITTSRVVHGDVNTFSGTYNVSYPLGTVNSGDGISYTVTLDYSGSGTWGDNVANTSGIPYGEGWSVSVPSITMNNIMVDEVATVSDPNHPQNGKYFTASKLATEGMSFGKDLKINLPGVASGALVYKYSDNHNDFYSLHSFEKFVEIRYARQTDEWEVVDESGNVYSFNVRKKSQLSPSNKNIVNTTSSSNPISVTDNPELYTPKEVTSAWYISFIGNKNKSAGSGVAFFYENFGKYENFKELKQDLISANLFGTALMNGGQLKDFTTYSDLILKSVYGGNFLSGGAFDKLDLDYATQYVDDNVFKYMFPLPGEDGVERVDSMYNKTVVYRRGDDNTANPATSLQFNSWNRYRHLKSDGAKAFYPLLGQYPATNNPVVYNFSNPYLYKLTGGNYYSYVTEPISTSGYIMFDHSFLESPRILQNPNDGFVPGDLYEIKTKIRKNETMMPCGFDINIVSGSYVTPYVNTYPSSLTSAMANDQSCGRDFTVFSTFRNPIKWYTGVKGLVSPNPLLETSNFFTMPNMPASFNGMNIQIGPSNSDHDFIFDNCATDGLCKGNATGEISAYNAHTSQYRENSANGEVYVPSNFGIGAAWRIVENLLKPIGDDPSVYPPYKAQRNKFWFKYNETGCTGSCPCSNPNLPTLAGDVTPTYNQSDAHPDYNASLKEVELVRYSKNPYMLKYVRHYTSNEGVTINPATQNVNPSDEWLLQSELELDYKFETRIIHDSKITNFYAANPNQNIYTDNRYQNVYLLKSIKNNPTKSYSIVSGVSNPGSGIISPITSFEYSIYDIKVFDCLSTSTTDNPFYKTTHDFYLLNKVIDPLGGITDIEYYKPTCNTATEYFTHTVSSPITKVVGSFANPPTLNTDEKLSRDRGFGVVQYTPVVKKITKHNSTGAPNKVYEYSYQNKISNTFSYFLPNMPQDRNYVGVMLSTNVGFGFAITTVLEPESSNGAGAPKTVYYYHNAPQWYAFNGSSVKSDDLLFGKLEKVEHYSPNNKLQSKQEFEYATTLAFLNGIYRDYTAYETTDPFMDHELSPLYNYDNGFSATPNWIQEVTSSNAKANNRDFFLWNQVISDATQVSQNFVESSTTLNSYFVKKKKETSTNFDYVGSYFKANQSIFDQQHLVGKFYDSEQSQIIASQAPNVFAYKYETTSSQDNTLPIDYSFVGTTFHGADISLTPISYLTETNFSYWDADYKGISSCDGFRILFNETASSTGTYQLSYEPSFQLYSKITTSPQAPGAFEKEENFYYFDILDNSSDAIPKTFAALYRGREKHIRNTLYQNRVTSKLSGKDAIAQSTYFVYTDQVKPLDGMDPDREYYELNDSYNMGSIPSPVLVPHMNPEQYCQTVMSQRGCLVATLEQLKGIQDIPQGYEVTDCGESKWICPKLAPISPYPVTSDHYTPIEVEPLYWSTEPMVTNGGTGGQSGIIVTGNGQQGFQSPYTFFKTNYYLSSVHVQVDEKSIDAYDKEYNIVSNSSLATCKTIDNSKDEYRILRFLPCTGCEQYIDLEMGQVGDPGYTNPQNLNPLYLLNNKKITNATEVYAPVFPYEQLRVHKVWLRNALGQERLSENINGVYTETRYQNRIQKEYHYLGNNKSQWLDVRRPPLPYQVVYGVGLPDSLKSTTSFYTNHSIKSQVDPNAITFSYDYDNFGRLSAGYMNLKLLKKYDYHLWDGNSTASFEDRAAQNWVKTMTFFEDNASKALVGMSYVDPLGRKASDETFVQSYPVTGAIPSKVISGKNVLDNWDRPIKSYKPYLSTVGPGLYSESKFFDEYSGHNKVANYGSTISQNHNRVTETHLLKAWQLAYELNLTSAQISEYMPSSSADYVFTRKLTSDEDGKIAIEYSGVMGNKIGNRQLLESGEEVITLFEQDSRKRTTKVINPKGLESTYKYNLMNNLVEEVTPEKGTSRFIYNKLGKVSLEVDAQMFLTTPCQSTNAQPAQIRQYIYDSYGRIKEQNKASLCLSCPTVNYNNDVNIYTCRLYPFDWTNVCDDFPLSNLVTNCQGSGTTHKQGLYSSASTYDWLGHNFKSCVSGNGPSATREIDYISPLSLVQFKQHEKTYNYFNDFDKLDNSIHQNARPYIANSLKFHRGKLTKSVSYNENGNPIVYDFYSYTSDGNLKWQIEQFKQSGITNTTPGTVSRIDYKDYNLAGSVVTENVDLGCDMVLDGQYHREYDDYGRLKNIYFNMTDVKANGFKVASFDYDPVSGLLSNTKYFYSKNVLPCGNNAQIDEITNTYDNRNRLTALSSTNLDYQMYYDDIFPVSNYNGSGNYNGNINGIRAEYKLGGANVLNNPGNFSAVTKYSYHYDLLNRLTHADYSPVSIGTANLSGGDETFTYDKIGNILTQNRFSLAGVQDNLNYSYSANNRLSSILNTISNTAHNSYTYDANGNLTSDQKRDVVMTQYGRANLPVQLRSGTNAVRYSYNVGDQRIYKESKPYQGANLGAINESEYYLKDASGQDVSVIDLNSKKLEWYVYGHNRIAKIGDKATSPWSGIVPFKDNHLPLSAIKTQLKPFEQMKFDKLKQLAGVLYETEKNGNTVSPIDLFELQIPSGEHLFLTKTERDQWEAAHPTIATTELGKATINSSYQRFVFERDASYLQQAQTSGVTLEPEIELAIIDLLY